MSALSDIIKAMTRYYTKQTIYHMAAEETKRELEKQEKNKRREPTEAEVAAAKAEMEKYFDNLQRRAYEYSTTNKNKNNKKDEDCDDLIKDDGNAGYSVDEDGHLTYDDHGEND